MPSTTSLIVHLRRDYPQFRFKESTDYLWAPSDHTVYFAPDNNSGLLLHELSHGLLDHVDYHYDIDLLSMERAAWNKAAELAKDYNISIDDEFVESSLDSYRNWLHARSSCPNCDATGLQIKKDTYSCPACRHKWRVNEARVCALRRYDLD